jgi:hypothetical protein
MRHPRQSADEHAFQPKWCSSSPTFGISMRFTIWPYDDEPGSRSSTPTASGSMLPLSPTPIVAT